METSEISVHQIAVYSFVREHGGWVTAREISDAAKVAPRTARHHASKFVKLGIFDEAEVFPAHRYRYSALAEKRNKSMVMRLNGAREIFSERAKR